jgi:hypothetical protein
MHTSFIYNYLKNTVSLYNFKIPLQMLYLKIILLYNIKKKKKNKREGLVKSRPSTWAFLDRHAHMCWS